MEEIKVESKLPVVTMNFVEVKNSLTETIAKYKNMVVTEEGLKDCKATQKDLAKIRNNIDTYRKTVKQSLEQPIKVFESQCNELIGLVVNAETPIKAGIEVFNVKIRNEKRQQAHDIIQEMIQTHELTEKYSQRLSLLDRYTQLSANLKIVKEDITQRAIALKDEQRQEIARKQMISDSIMVFIESANETINNKLKYENFEKFVNMGWELPKILKEINDRAVLIRETETPKIIERPTEPFVQELPIPLIVPVEVTQKFPTFAPAINVPEKPLEVVRFIEMRVTGNYEKLMALSSYLKSNEFDYSLLSQGAI